MGIAVTVSKYFRVSRTRSMRDKGLEGRKVASLRPAVTT